MCLCLFVSVHISVSLCLCISFLWLLFCLDYNYFSNGQFFTISKFHENPNFLRILDSYL